MSTQIIYTKFNVVRKLSANTYTFRSIDIKEYKI
jgi:hypothetical protein